MLELPTTTLFCADCVNAERAVAVIERCKAVANFGAVKLMTSLPCDYVHAVPIQHLPSLVDYSIWMLKRANQYVGTQHMLVVQHDGFILNPESWDPAWLQYDYIGPLFIQDRHITHLSVGSGGFSFRSRKLMDYVNARTPPWTGNGDTANVQAGLGAYEDGVICLGMRGELTYNGFKFAPPEVACKFAQGGWPEKHLASRDDRTYYHERPFGFHGGWRQIDHKTGFVSPPPFGPYE